MAGKQKQKLADLEPTGTIGTIAIARVKVICWWLFDADLEEYFLYFSSVFLVPLIGSWIGSQLLKEKCDLQGSNPPAYKAEKKRVGLKSGTIT